MNESVLRLAFRMVNAYLVRADDGFILIDTGFRSNRKALDAALIGAGCGVGDLKLIMITHGDADHSSNAVYLRQKFGAKIAMHRAEVDAVESGNMFRSRGPLSPVRRLLKPLMSLFRLKKGNRFTPDVLLDEGDRLTSYGLDATVFHVPGHTRGSLAVLTADGAFFSGDFLQNRTRPSIATFVDDAAVLRSEFKRIKTLNIQTVYPGHGKPFALEEIG
ncbi:MBL fold metallo-hydrolase [Candidatus Bipolaricaulota bacterium]|nr:MBL fold metallo-hydrolase [Candidatus Bipolaricaulota bacterium]